MGLFGWLAIMGLVGVAADAYSEDKKRKNTYCGFEDGISKEEFERIAKSAVKSIKRIKQVEFVGPWIRCVVRSQSGISEWSFVIDFNDYGHITGRYWLSSGNSDSNIPRIVADRIQEEIVSRL